MWKYFLTMMLLSGILIQPVHGSDLLWEQAKIDALERTANQIGTSAEFGESLDEGLLGVLMAVGSSLGDVLRDAVQSGVLLMMVVLLCGLCETVLSLSGGTKIPITALAGTLAITAVSIGDVNSMLGLGRGTISGITSFSNVLLPCVAVITAATGAVTGAAVRQTAATLFSDLLVNVIERLLIPILYGYLAACVAFAAVGNEGLKRVGSLLKHTVTTLLTSIMLIFVGYLSISGVVAGSADTLSVKAAKFAISGSIPVVGGILSDAAETILVSAGVLRGSVGVFGTITVLSVCLVPLLRIAAHYLVYKLAAALSATVGRGAVSTLVDDIGSAFGLMLGMAGACSLLLLISLVTSSTAVSI